MIASEFDSIYLKKFNKIEFAKKYKSASGILFEKSEKNEYKYEIYLKLLLNTYNDKEQMKFIKQVNDYLNLSPVYVWVKLNEKNIKEYYQKEKIAPEDRLEHINQNTLRISIGAFWGWVMLYDTANKNEKKYIKKSKKHYMNSQKAFGFKSAALFEEK